MAENRPNIPAWLPVSEQPRQPSIGSSPEWLGADNPATRPTSGGSPDWLNAEMPSASPTIDLPSAPVQPADAGLPSTLSPAVDFPDLPPLPFEEAEEEPEPGLEASASMDDDDDLFGIFDREEADAAPSPSAAEAIVDPLADMEADDDASASDSDIPDWLGGENLPLPGRAEASEDSATEDAGLPSWLDDVDVPDLPEEEPREETPEVASTDELDALLGIGGDEDDLDEFDDGLPGFRRDYRSRVTGELRPESDERDEPGTEAGSADVPDWISAAAAAPASDDADEADLDVPDWILSTAEDSDDDVPAAVVDVPDWIAAEAGTDTEAEPTVEDRDEEAVTETAAGLDDLDDLSDLFGERDDDTDTSDGTQEESAVAAQEGDFDELADLFGDVDDGDDEHALTGEPSQSAAALDLSDIFGDAGSEEEELEAGVSKELEAAEDADEADAAAVSEEEEQDAEAAEALAGPDLSDIFGDMEEEEAAPETSASAAEDDGFEWLRSPIQEATADEADEEEEDLPDFLETLGAEEAAPTTEDEAEEEVEAPAPLMEDEGEAEAQPAVAETAQEEADDFDDLADLFGDADEGEGEDALKGEPSEAAAALDLSDIFGDADSKEEEEEEAGASQELEAAAEVEDEKEAEEEAELPAFLADMKEPEETAVAVSDEDEEAEAGTEEAAELPAFLAGIKEPDETAAAVSDDEEAEAETEEAAELPAFLAGIATPDEAESESVPARAAVDDSDLPDWLGGIEETDDKEDETADKAAREEAELPAFLADIKEAPESYEAELDQAGEEGELPDWFSGIDAPDHDSSAEPAEAPAAVSEEGDLPDWLSDIDEPDEQDKEIDAAITGQDVDMSARFGEEKDEAEPAKATSEAKDDSGSDLPDWFSDIEAPELEEEEDEPEAEAALSMEEAEVAIAPESDSGGTPDWLDSITFGDEESPLPKISLPDDTGELAEFTPASSITSDADISATLDEIVTGGGSVPAAPTELPPLEIPPDVEVEPDLADQIGDLRFEQITSDAESMTGAEKVGALKELTGVIQPEMIFEGESLRAAGIADDVVISKDQAKRIELLDALLSGPTGVTVIDDGPGFPIDRWLATILLLFAILVPSVLGFRLLPPPVRTPRPVVDTQTEIDNLPLDPVVMVALEYEPDAAPELEPLGIALLSHVAELDNSRVYAISTRPTGPAMIDALFEQTEPERPEGPAWVNLGYVSGGANGISNLIIGSLSAGSSPLAYDYQGQETNLNADQITDIQPDLVIVIAARYEHLQPWIEQAGPGLGAPMIAAMSAASAPMAYPYQQSGQLVTVLNGVNDAAAYQLSRIGAVGSTDIGGRWNAQALGGLAAAGLIIAGGVMFGLIALRRTEEPE